MAMKILSVALLLVALHIVSSEYAYADYKTQVSRLSKCPGLYCGRTPLVNGSWSACGACPRGFRSNPTTSACEECSDTPHLYDWLYLGFSALLTLALHWFAIDSAGLRRLTLPVVSLHICAVVEVGAAALATLLLSAPRGTLELTSCHVQRLADWYTLLHNPSPGYGEALHCTQEAVYPLYTLVLIFYAACVISMLSLRPWLVGWLLPVRGKQSIYAALYFFPGLALIHAIWAGLIYYSFPYIVIVLSVLSSAAHFAFKLDQSAVALVVQTVRSPRSLLIVAAHWAAHAYGIASVTQLSDPVLAAALLALVPLPAAFYIATAAFTEPSKIHSD